MTNVVLVRHEADYGFGNYLFETPVDLKKGQRVRVKTRRGESDAMNACHYLIDTDVPRGIHLHECYKRSGTPYRPGKKV